MIYHLALMEMADLVRTLRIASEKSSGAAFALTD